MKQPALFISHGAPDIAVRPSPVRDYLVQFGKDHPRPDAIIIASAHYETLRPEVGGAAHPETIYDFGGFAPELYEMKYRAPGAPELAAEVASAFREAGLEARVNPAAGFDHGIWTPLILAFPQADIPVVPVSVQPDEDAAHHYRLGRALAPFRDRNILVVGSGHITHNLRAMFQAIRGGAVDRATETAIDGFIGWINGKLAEGDVASLLKWMEEAPHALANHPTPEHFMPFFVALGAGDVKGSGAVTAELAHSSKMFGAFNSDFWLFREAA
ncbi:MAG: dioxygenase [Nitratireductor sp.]|nr:dioxygenase [Nitratireductor sp.]